MTALRCFALAALVAIATAGFAQSELPPTAADWTEIRRVIAAQRDALVQEDGERAFSFATPAIRRHFGDADNFVRMVRESYRALLDARYVEFLEGAVIAGDVVQPLRLVLPDGTVMVAIYGMQRETDGRWRINACVIAPSTVRSA